MTATRNLILLLVLGAVVVISDLLLIVLTPAARRSYHEYDELWSRGGEWDDPGRDVDEEDS